MKKIAFDIDNDNNKNNDLNDDSYYQIEKQYEMIINFQTNNINDISLNKIIKREISKKLSSYKSQDKKNGKYDEEQHITYEELVNKLVSCKLKCYYCNEDIFLLYKKRGEPLQWSLERLDNNIGHYARNTCISCLKCNLQRRTGNYEYFKFSKNMKITKV